MESVRVLVTEHWLGIGFVQHSPLGRSFLTGAFKSPVDLEKRDFRKTNQDLWGITFRKTRVS